MQVKRPFFAAVPVGDAMLNRIDELAAFIVLGVTHLAGCAGSKLNEARAAPHQGSSFDAPAAVSNNAAATRGQLDGVWFWTMPTTPNGLVPTQSWSGAAPAPEGDVYVAGMDHSTNSALYRLHGDSLSYLGDAKSASAAAENWRAGETAQKFHVRPIWHNGRVYVATYGSSTLDATYLSLRGFHWYAISSRFRSILPPCAMIVIGIVAPHLP